jgi:hypothetical protein
MAKLYWRIKKNGKWTWRPAKVGSRLINPIIGLRNWGFFVQEEEE